MVRAWYLDDSTENDRKPHMRDPNQFLDLDTLKTRTGIEYFKLDADNFKEEGLLDKIRKDRGYTYEDQITITKTMDNYLGMLATFYREHIHSDEEIRFTIDGSGYFDVRDKDDSWIRIEIVKGDMIILPAGIYHRFTLDVNDYIYLRRYFVGEPVWTPYPRPCEDHPSRAAYVKNFIKA